MFPKLDMNLLSLRVVTFEQKNFNVLMSGLLNLKAIVFFLVEESMIVLVKSLVILHLKKMKILRAFLISFMTNE